MDRIQLNSFNQWIAWAQQDLASLPPAEFAPQTRAIMIKHATTTVEHALKAANRLGCPARKAMCLRVLNWLRADRSRAPSARQFLPAAE